MHDSTHGWIHEVLNWVLHIFHLGSLNEQKGGKSFMKVCAFLSWAELWFFFSVSSRPAHDRQSMNKKSFLKEMGRHDEVIFTSVLRCTIRLFLALFREEKCLADDDDGGGLTLVKKMEKGERRKISFSFYSTDLIYFSSMLCVSNFPAFIPPAFSLLPSFLRILPFEQCNYD